MIPSSLYSNLPSRLIVDICRKRDILPPKGDISSMRAYLSTVDNIMSDWALNALSTPMRAAGGLSRYETLYLGAFKGLNYNLLSHLLSIDELCSITRLFLGLYRGDNETRAFLSLTKEGQAGLLAQKGISIEIAEILDTNEKLAVLSGDTKTISPDEIQRRRARRSLVLSSSLADKIIALYPDEHWWKCKPSPVEAILLQFPKTPISEITQRYGIVPPPYSDHRTYTLDALCNYTHVLQRDLYWFPHKHANSYASLRTYLQQLTDTEILQHVGAYYSYRSRQGLIDNGAALSYRKGFFVPFVRHPKLSALTETISGTPIEDYTCFMVAHGTLDHYYLYEMDDFRGAFYRSENDTYPFRRPEDVNQTFTVEEIGELLQLLDCYSTNVEIGKTIHCIRQALLWTQEMLKGEEGLLPRCQALSPADRVTLRELLWLLFQGGMYMRRWSGPPHPYPLEARDTNAKLNPERKALPCFGEILCKLETVSSPLKKFFDSLNYIKYQRKSGGFSLRIDGKLHSALKIILSGATCIRMASSNVVSTAHHYLRLFFQEEIDGYDPQKLEPIA